MANVACPSFRLINEQDHDLGVDDNDPCLNMDQITFLDLFSSVFDQETGSCEYGGIQDSCSKNKSMNGVIKNPPSWDVRRPREEEEEEAAASSLCDHRLSMEEILMVAGEKFIQFSTNRIDGVSMLFHPYGSSISGLCLDDERDVDIMHTLLSAAEKVGLNHLDAAARLVSRCRLLVSESGTPVQRLAAYFSAALEQRMRGGRGGQHCVVTKRLDDHKGLALGTSNAFLASHQQLPFEQVAQFAGIQAIIEQVRGCSKVHLIDLQIRSGIHWTALMQGLSDASSLRRLKITAVGTADQAYMEETCLRLQSFAASLNIPFLFNIVYLQEMDAFSEDVLKIEPDETVAVCSFMMLRSMISRPRTLDTVMRAVASIRPVVMVVSEVEANHNSPSFIDRFTEALLFYSAYFDCLEECMERGNEYRSILEGRFFGEGIMNIVASEGEERVTRNVKVSVWRKFFMRFGMKEMELSESSKYQASLVLEQFSKGRFCNLDFDGKALIVGWKGTPIQSLTAWSFT